MLSKEQALMFLESIGSNDSIGVTIVDANGIVIYRSRGQEQISGQPNSVVLGNSIFGRSGFEEIVTVLETGTAKFSLPYNTVFGTQAVIHVFPLRDKEYRTIGTMSVTAYTDMKDMEKVLCDPNDLKRRPSRHDQQLTKYGSARYSFNDLIGKSRRMLSAVNLAKKYALSDSPVLITGESGTGKELFAHAIHLDSNRKRAPFVVINCPSIPESLLESEIFGYAAGAFSGATQGGKIGKLEMANNGTVFLDEVATLNLSLQPKLLRTLQDQRIEKLGSNRYVDLDFRVVAATNQDLRGLVAKGQFREDLYYRIGVLNIDLPPLRERKEDIPLLIEHFLNSFRQAKGLVAENVSNDALDVLYEWSWPGNLRELKNVMEKAATSCDSTTIELKDLPNYLFSGSLSKPKDDGLFWKNNILKLSKQAAEKTLVETKLSSNNWNKSKTAKELGVSRPLLYSLIRKYGLRKPQDFEASRKTY